jgi:hypothetical protein
VSDSFEAAEPSHGEANKMLRVLSGERLKYTVRVIMLDGKIIEWQSNEVVRTKYNDEARSLWLCTGEYAEFPIMPWPDGGILLVEKNPKA